MEQNNSSMQWLLDNCAELKVEYDPSVLLTNSEELELVDNFSDSICCRR